MSTPDLKKVYPLIMKGFKEYDPIPENANIIEKINDMVVYLNSVGRLSSDVVYDWNNVMQWSLGEGLKEATSDKVDKLILDNKIPELINPFVDKITEVAQEQIDLIDNNQVATKQEMNVVTEQLAQNMNKHDSEYVNVLFPPAPLTKAVGDGSDETTILQNILNYCSDNKKIFYIPFGYTFIVNGLSLLNKSNFGIDVIGTLKRKNIGQNIPILKLDGCSNFKIFNYTTDGNVVNNGNTVQEGGHSLSLLNSYDFQIDKIIDKNPLGDTVYINHSDRWYINFVSSYSDGNTGRNGVSIIAGVDWEINQVLSINTGYSTMPGGVDLEPNVDSDVIKNGAINYALVKTKGSNGIAIMNGTNTPVENISINGYVEKDTTNGAVLYLVGVNHFKGHIIGKCLTNKTTGLFLDKSNFADVYFDCDSAATGAILGYTTPVNDFKIRGIIQNTTSHIFNIYNANNGLIDMTLRNCGTSSNIIQKATTGTSDNIVFKGDYSKGISGNCLFLSNVAVTNWIADGVNATGWANGKKIVGALSTGFFAKNCPNLNYGTASQTSDQWSLGSIIWNTNPSLQGTTGSQYVITGWVCTTAGAGGTFQPMRTLTGS